MSLRAIVLSTLAAAVTVAGAPAGATSTVTVNFGVSAGRHLPTGVACPVSVPAGANGIAVLNAAVAKRCIESYRTVSYPFGVFVDCINRICGAPAEAFYLTYWNMYENGVSTSYGVSQFVAHQNDELVFAYATWVAPL